MQAPDTLSLCVVRKIMENNDVIVYRLGAGCDLSDVEEGKIYQAKVQGFGNVRNVCPDQRPYQGSGAQEQYQGRT